MVDHIEWVGSGSPRADSRSHPIEHAGMARVTQADCARFKGTEVPRADIGSLRCPRSARPLSPHDDPGRLGPCVRGENGEVHTGRDSLAAIAMGVPDDLVVAGGEVAL